MTWGMVAGAAISAVGGMVAGGKQNKAAGAQYVGQLQQEKLQWEQNSADNKAVDDANLTNTIRTGYKVGLLNVQQANAKKAALAQGFNLGKSGREALSSNAANAAANGSIGNSVSAVVSDIQSKIGDAGIQQVQDFAVQTVNFETMLHDLLTQGQDSLQSGRNANVQHANAPQLVGMGDVLTNTALKAGSQYAGSMMNLGLGSTPDRAMKTFDVSAQSVAPTMDLSSTSFLSGLKSS